MSRPITRRAALAASLGWLLAGEIAKPASKRDHPQGPTAPHLQPLPPTPIREIDEFTW
jgi:hypothetical protein